ncbi:MAG: hypothetical protein JNK79_08425 [Chitinophagaceae bacterium]|nr:hypothetical protein [Chitinophagaceae bacterium]
MHRRRWQICIMIILLSALAGSAIAQPGGALRRLPGGGGGYRGSSGGKKDSLERRNSLQDSITISFRYIDSSRLQKFDSSIYDFTQRFPVPWYHYHLGNVGNATHSLIFEPILRAGWDHGFHAYDDYTFNDYDTRFFNTTRPFTEIQYQLGSKLEQVLGLIHTQNIKPSWNASFQYRLINSPGIFRNQHTNDNNYRFTNWFQTKNKRYQNFFVIVGNKLMSSENGGIKDDINYLDSAGAFDERGNIPTRLGSISEGISRNNFFTNNIATGTRYTSASYIMRHQYDLVGNKDSIVTDSTVIPLFYPRLRAELTTSLKTYNYRFNDTQADSSLAFYKSNYNIDTPHVFAYQDKWQDLTNDFSIYQFPDAKNSQQFFKAGAAFQMLRGTFDTGTVTNRYHNFFIHGEYRNKTRNRKWDIIAFGNFYVNGMNAGDYDARVSLKRLISQSIGSLQLGFSNTNRTPSFVFDSTSSFYLGEYRNFNKENYTEIFGAFDIPKLRASVQGKYMLISNYTYFSNYRQPEQYGTLFNLLQVSAEKQFRFGKRWNWKSWVVIQKLTGNPPINLPVFLTRNMIGYDGNLGFKNLLTSFGLEIRYYTPYKADRYSPLMGQFFNQNDTTIKMQLPDIAAYFHFRIKSFTTYLRFENLNAYDFSTNKFTRNNLVSPNYPYPGLQLRVGVYWTFVN